MSFFDKIDQCYCGHEFKKDEQFCSKCGRARFKMSALPGKADSVDDTMKKSAQAKDTAKRIWAFQLARTKGGK